MNVEEFIDQIAGKGLLDEALLQRLRQDVTAAGNQWTPQDVVKFLIEQGHLTRFQGKNLLKDVQAAKSDQHESLELVASESIDGLSIGAVTDDDDDDEEIIDLKAAMPATDSTESASNAGEEVVDLGQAVQAAQAGQANTLPATPRPAAAPSPLQPLGMPGQVSSVSEGNPVDAVETESFGYDEIPTTLLDRQFNNQIWDKKFFYAAIVVMLLFGGGGGVFYFIINNQSADAKFEAANKKYMDSEYEEAVVEMTEFAKSFPTDARADEARALVYLSRIHMAEKTQKGEAIAQMARDITTGKDIPGFSSRARDELKIVLPRFAKVFLGRAESASAPDEKEKNYVLAVEALDLINLPGALGTTRSEPAVRLELEAIDERMASVRRHIDRDTHLGEALVQMSQSAQTGKVADAFNSRRQLLDLYPELKGDQRLSSVLTQLLDAERALVGKSKATWQASTDTAGVAIGAAVTATTSGQAIPGAQGELAVLAGGNAVGLNAADGRVLWQQYVGLQTNLLPVQVGTVTILADQQNHEILAVRNSDGTLLWKLPLQEAITSLTSLGNSVAITLHRNEGGVFLVVDSTNGAVQMQVNTSLGLVSAPAFNRDTSTAYLVADHSFVYAVAMESGKCLDVYFLNHGIGAVPFPPVVANDYLVVAQNLDDETDLITLRQQDQEPFLRCGTQVRVPGMLSSELAVSQNRLLVVTGNGELRLYDVVAQQESAEPVLEPLSAVTMSSVQSARHFVEVEGVRVLVGAAGLTEYAITDDGQLNEVSQTYEGDSFIASTQTISSVSVTQRQRVGASAVTVSGLPGNGQGGWETDLAALSDSAIVSDGEMAVTVDPRAQVFNVQTGGNTGITAALASSRGFSHAVSIGKRLVLQSLTGAADLLVFDSLAEGVTANRVVLQDLTGEPADAGVAFSGQLLLPLDDGQLTLFDVTTGKQSLVAYQPVKQPEELVHWSAAALPADDAKSFVVVRDRRSIQRIGINPLPLPHLELQAEAVFDVPVYDQVAAVGETVYLIRRGRNNDEMVGLSYETLEEASAQEVSGRVIWGPHRIGEVVLVYTSATRLYCFGSQQELIWRSEKVDLRPVGSGLQDGVNYLLTGVDGTLWRVNAADGTTVNQTSLKQRVIGTPFVVSGEVWVPTEAGVLSGTVQE